MIFNLFQKIRQWRWTSELVFSCCILTSWGGYQHIFFRWMAQISSNHLFQPLQFADRFVDHYPVTRTTPWTGTNSFVSKRIVDTASPFPTPPLGLFFDPMSWLTHAQVISFTCHSFCNSEPLEDAGHMWRLMLRLEAAQGDPLTTAKLLLNRCLTFSGKGTLSLQRSL